MTAENADETDTGEGTESEGLHPFMLEFVVNDCENCDALRSADVVCENCGHPVVKEGGPVASRRALTDTCVAELKSTVPPPGSVEAEPQRWFGNLYEWTEQFLSSVAELTTSDGKALMECCTELRQLAADAAATRRYRPDLSGWAAVDDILDLMATMAAGFIESLRASTPVRAEDEAGRAQAALDAIGSRLDRWSGLEASWRMDQPGLPSDPAAKGSLLAARLVGSESLGMVAADASGHELVRKVTGLDVCPTGMGFAFQLLDAHAQATMDPERFWSMVGLTFRRITKTKKGKPTFADVASSPGWLDDMVFVQNQLTEALRELGTGLDQPTPLRLGRALVRLGHLNAERAAKYLMATVLASAGGRQYQMIRQMDFGALQQDMRDRKLDELLLGIDAAMRHGDAHGEFAIEDDGVRFTANRREYDFLDWDELLDRVLAGLETTVAMHAAVLCAAESQGIDVSALGDIRALFALEDRVALLGAADGWSEIRVEVDEGTVDISATSLRPGSFTTVGTISGCALDQDVKHLRVKISSPTAVVTFEGPTDVQRAFLAEESGYEKEARFIDVIRTWKHNGSLIIDGPGLRKVVSYNVMSGAVDDSVPILRKPAAMRPWLGAAQRAGDEHLSRAVADLIAGVRNAGQGFPLGVLSTAAVEQLTAWGSVDMSWGLDPAA